MNMPIRLPFVKEQEKLAEFLNLIEERIALQNKVIEDLKQLKTAISRRILWGNPLLTKRVPLGLLGELKNGYAFKSTTYIPNTKYHIITIANVSGERVINSKDCNTIPVLPKDLQQHQLLKPNDILISLTGNVGRVSLCCNNYSCLLNQRVGLFIPNDPKLHEYLFQVLSDERFLHSMIDAGQGAAQMNIGKGDIESFPIPFVDNPFMLNRIAVVLNSLDLRIIMAKRKLLLLKKQKIHLMNALFI
jgi:type I restriction enzyme S subunit